MNVGEFASKYNMKIVAGVEAKDNEIKGGYICDLLSYVMGQAKEGDAWITVQTNPNVVAVSTLTNIACIIIPSDIEVDAKTIEKADQNDIPILSSKDTAFDLACMIKECL